MEIDVYEVEEKLIDSVAFYEPVTLDRYEAEALLNKLDDLEIENSRSEWLWIFLYLAGWSLLFSMLADGGAKLQ